MCQACFVKGGRERRCAVPVLMKESPLVKFKAPNLTGAGKVIGTLLCELSDWQSFKTQGASPGRSFTSSI